MRSLALALCLAAPIVAPAAAQEAPAAGELAARYAAVLDAFFLPGVAPDDPTGWLDDAGVQALLPGLEGVWLPSVTLVAPSPEALDPGLLAQECGRRGATLAATTSRSFELSHPAPDGASPFVERYDFVAGTTFLRSFDEAAYLTRVYGPDAEAVVEGLVPFTLLQAGRGEVVLFHPSPELLVLVQPSRPPEVLLRCP